VRRWLGHAVAAAILLALLARLGTGPFQDGLRHVDALTVAGACGLAIVTTTACAWRWQTVARGLGAGIPLPAAVAAYYRSLFLNLSLPGGVAGDVHRGLGHGVRAVFVERSAGQVVQVTLTVAVLLVAPSPVHAAMPVVAVALVIAALAAVALGRRRRWPAAAVLSRRAWTGIALASILVLAGHVATFVIAARAAGVDAPASQLLPLALLVLTAAALPNVGGWGPREGATAWAFGAAGLGASAGIATAVVYGVLVLAAGLPGALVLAGTPMRRRGARSG